MQICKRIPCVGECVLLVFGTRNGVWSVCVCVRACGRVAE